MRFVLLFLVLLSPALAQVQVPELAKVPAAVTGPERARLGEQRRLLLDQKFRLADQLSAHNRRCQKVADGSPRAIECQREKQALMEKVDLYSKEVRVFNRLVLRSEVEALSSKVQAALSHYQTGIQRDRERLQRELERLSSSLQVRPASEATIEEGLLVDQLVSAQSPLSGEPFQVFVAGSEPLPLEGARFERLWAHGRGANLAQVLLRKDLIQAEEVHLLGGDRTLVNSAGLEQLVGRVKKLVVWLSPGDCVPMGSSAILLSAYGRALPLEAVVQELTPAEGVEYRYLPGPPISRTGALSRGREAGHLFDQR